MSERLCSTMTRYSMGSAVPVHGVEGHRTNARGQKLFTVTYCATSDQRAVLFHRHGYGEHVSRMWRCKLVRRNVTNLKALRQYPWSTVAVLCTCRMQAKVGDLLATLVPRARLVPAVDPNDMSQDRAVVRSGLRSLPWRRRRRLPRCIAAGIFSCAPVHAAMRLRKGSHHVGTL